MATKIKIRKKPISRGRYSLYLEFYPPIMNPETKKRQYKEFLGIYVYVHPQNKIQRDYNSEMMLKAEAIRSLRVQSVINEEFTFLDKHKYKKDFLQYFYNMAQRKNVNWMSIYKHFQKFTNGRCTFGDIDVDLCRQFREYLLSATDIKRPDRKICNNTASCYFRTFRGILKIANRDSLLKNDVNPHLDRIEKEDTKIDFLTFDELMRLYNTPCDIPVLRNASIFACLTGLRISDILQLRWEHINEASEGGYCVRIRTEKSETETTLPISMEAFELCGPPAKGIVFKGLKRSMLRAHLKNWLIKAGITKKITFHCFRHTFATLQVAFGTDIFTISKMLTHKHVTTTEIYAEVVNEKKRESANRIVLKNNNILNSQTGSLTESKA